MLQVGQQQPAWLSAATDAEASREEAETPSLPQSTTHKQAMLVRR